MAEGSAPSTNVMELTADVVAAYLSHNSVRAEDLPSLINTVHAALGGAGTQGSSANAEKHEPPVPWKKAIRPDYIISFEDGKQYKSMRRHLSTRGMTPEQYREKWGLPHDFPMVAPSYSARRSEMAKSLGLGTKMATARKAKGGSRKKAAAE